MIESTTQHRFIDMLAQGGWLMIPLAFCSLLALAIIVERFFWGPRKEKVLPEQLYRDVSLLIQAKRFDEILGICKAHEAPFAKIVLASIRNIHRPREELVEAIQVAGRREAVKLRRFVGILGTIAAISPLLGLLGTVFGMISTFQVISFQGIGNGPALAGGISEALITTATGLTIAIPSLVFHRYFVHQTNSITMLMEESALSIVDQIGYSKTITLHEKTALSA